ncbi:hypothetical protein V1264_011381 [Littorina saxatilis]
MSAILSAEELFRCRKRENLSVPQRGGAKDYEPDGSWLQDKRLEAFYEEHQSVLAEPRVEKSGSLVKGTWSSEMRLVNLEKTAKFWMKMGFADQQRNWLHPEEALFLMEVNCLDLRHQGLSLSLQEACDLLLHPSCDISEEEYQVYAHLRRLGFIVIRHAGKLDVTSYEKKIGLDKHARKKTKKNSKSKTTDCAQTTKCDEGNQTNISTDTQRECLRQAVCDREPVSGKQTEQGARNGSETLLNKVTGSKGSNQPAQNKTHSPLLDIEAVHNASESTVSEENAENRSKADEFTAQQNSRQGSETKIETTVETTRDTESGEPPVKKLRVENQNSKKVRSASSVRMPSLQDPWSSAIKQSLLHHSSLGLSSWDFSITPFPDMGGTETVSLPIPPSHLLPPNTGVDEDYEDVCMFDVEEYRQQQQLQSHRSVLNQEDEYGHLKSLDFSYAEWYQKHSKPINAKNWREWKAELRQRENSFIAESPVAHLWRGEVTPLVQPTDATSTAALLNKLSVIQPFKGPFPENPSPDAVRICFDVYLPNTSFKKSSPGLPDHRVCVVRGDHPPDVMEVHATTAHLADDVPLHWAVVNCGEISFFVFDDLDLPVNPSSVG